MPEENSIVEIVVYRIKADAREAYVSEALERFRKLVMSFDGFIRYDVFEGCRDKNEFVDFVQWESLEQAEAAAKAVKQLQQAPEYANYLTAFEKLDIFTHVRKIRSWA
ncbi:MAG: antibiotic biosynthesis monooxygenase [Alphaproteobacteria bacterium]|nr:antibiotic biosynthesis monooxygenase [Alphaproteobacteria bacterium]